MGIFNANAMYDKEMQQWTCMVCKYTSDSYQWYQVLGHIAATHGYTSRTTDERCGIRIDGEYTNSSKLNLTRNIKRYMAAVIDNDRIQIQTNDINEIVRKCG